MDVTPEAGFEGGTSIMQHALAASCGGVLNGGNVEQLTECSRRGNGEPTQSDANGPESKFITA